MGNKRDDGSGEGKPARRAGAWFVLALGLAGGFYVALIVAVVLANFLETSPSHALSVMRRPEIAYSIRLSVAACTITSIVSLWVAVPLGYLLSRGVMPRWAGAAVDAIVDIPIVLPPMAIGLSLLILFETPAGRAVQRMLPITYAIPAVILAQFAVACALAVRTVRLAFDEAGIRGEQVARVLGCGRAEAFWRVAVPEAWRGIAAAGTLAWAKAMGEFGPILVFAGATRRRTEVLSTSVFLELNTGDLRSAAAVSLVMVLVGAGVLVLMRMAGGPAVRSVR